MRAFEAEWRARFERFGRTYREEYAVSGWSAEGLTRRFKLFEAIFAQIPLQTPARVLELGCGPGTYVRYLRHQGHRVVGVDYSLPSLRRAVDADPGHKGGYVAADGYELPFAERSFDVVVCIGVLQALSRPAEMLDEILRVLRPHGVVVMEALNAFELPAMARRMAEILTRRPPRVRAYAVFRIRRCLEVREVQLVRRVGVYLPPRRFPALGRFFDHAAVSRLLEKIPGVSLLLAHAFWLVGRKTS